MIPQQNLITYPLFGDNATKTQPDDAKMSAGFQQSDVLPAEWMNWAWNKNSKGITDLNSGIASIEKELIAVLTEADITPALATEDQVKTALYTIIRANASNYYTASCSTAADEEVKSIVISGFYNNGKTTVGVTFANENTYGDTTADTPTNPKLSINGTEYDICDSRGHIAGTGCWNADDYIEFLIVGTKALITNSEVRQSVSGTSGYTIYSNGKIVYTSIINGVGTDLTLKKKTVTATANSYGIIYKGSTFTSTEKILGTEKVVYAVCTSGDDNIVRLGYHRSNGIWLQVIGYSGTYASNTSITITFYYL